MIFLVIITIIVIVGNIPIFVEDTLQWFDHTLLISVNSWF